VFRYFAFAVVLSCVLSTVRSAPSRHAFGGEFASPASSQGDWRNVLNGFVIPDEGYCDQPYVVVTRQGHWLCTLTTSPGREGEKGQHIVATISTDQGRTWSSLVEIEPAGQREASWAVPLMVPSGRVYVFYTYNGDDIRELRGRPIRADTLGWYAYKYSDDGGRTWSPRYRLPLRITACDRNNDWQGAVQLFWGIDKPEIVGSDVYFAFTKLGRYILELGEGWVFHSDNILTEPEVARIRWQLLPDGEHGIRAPEFGSVQEEHNLVAFSDGTLYCVYRTTLGHPCESYSRDGGKTWSKPQPMRYTPGGRKIKTPRACPMLWRTKEGKYLFWFHNNGHTWFDHWARNPVWITGGVERDGAIHWAEPEILLYDPNPKAGMSYPDLIEQDGAFWVTETQKTVARVHPIDRTLFEGLWNQANNRTISRTGLLLDLTNEQLRISDIPISGKLDLGQSGGLTVDLWIEFATLEAGQVILDTRTPNGVGFALSTTPQGTVQIELNDGASKVVADCDPGILLPARLHHIVVSVDSGPQVISFVVDGQLCNGGEKRVRGWHQYSEKLGDITGSGNGRIAAEFQGRIKRLRVYNRFFRTSEAVAHFRAGPSA